MIECMKKLFDIVLVVNWGEIVVCIIKMLWKKGFCFVVVYYEVDVGIFVVVMVDMVIRIEG